MAGTEKEHSNSSQRITLSKPFQVFQLWLGPILAQVDGPPFHSLPTDEPVAAVK